MSLENPRQISEAIQLAQRHVAAGQMQQAYSICQQVLANNPRCIDALYLVGLIALQAGRPEQAISTLERAVAPQKDDGPVPALLAAALCESGRTDESLAIFARLVARDPMDANNLSNYAKALNQKGQFDQAIEAAGKAISIQPQGNEQYLHLAFALLSTGRIAEAIATFRQRLAINPGLDRVHSNVLFLSYFDPTWDMAAIHAEHVRWNNTFGLPLRNQFRIYANNRMPDRRLRVGYFSADFRDHCQSLFTIPLLSSHHHDKFEVFCYSDVRKIDSVTQRIRGHSDIWRNTFGLPDARLAEMIISDRIDILVDLTMHMNGGRPLLFARKPAPIQVAWLAYPGTTGLTAMDYRLTDPYLDPPGMNDNYYSEQSIRLPHTFWCYDALSNEPAVNELPADANGFITFGCLNSFLKMNDAVLKVWSRVFQDLPLSRLLMMAPQGSARQRIIDGLGIDPGRVEFVDRQLHDPYMATYHRIDLCLDTFPYNGHTTSLDALWMGVPVISRYGQTAVSRAGLSQASNLGLTELVTDNAETFVKIAVELANDLPRLRHLRATLRQRIQASPLMDAKLFAGNIEEAYRTMWRRWCESDGPTTIGR